MKKALKSFLIILAITVTFCFSLTGISQANAKTEKTDIVVVRTTEGDRHYIEVYTDSGTLILKFEEL